MDACLACCCSLLLYVLNIPRGARQRQEQSFVAGNSHHIFSFFPLTRQQAFGSLSLTRASCWLSALFKIARARLLAEHLRLNLANQLAIGCLCPQLKRQARKCRAQGAFRARRAGLQKREASGVPSLWPFPHQQAFCKA